jgi:hypothetical protein
MACQAFWDWVSEYTRPVFSCAVAAALVAGCDAVATKKEQTGSSTTVSVQFDRAEFERQREEYRRSAQTKIAEFEAQLADLGRKADAASGDAKVRLQKEADAQRGNLDRAKEELKEIDAVVGERWAEFQKRSSKALDELGTGLRRAVDEFRK